MSGFHLPEEEGEHHILLCKKKQIRSQHVFRLTSVKDDVIWVQTDCSSLREGVKGFDPWKKRVKLKIGVFSMTQFSSTKNKRLNSSCLDQKRKAVAPNSNVGGWPSCRGRDRVFREHGAAFTTHTHTHTHTHTDRGSTKLLTGSEKQRGAQERTTRLLSKLLTLREWGFYAPPSEFLSLSGRVCEFSQTYADFLLMWSTEQTHRQTLKRPEKGRGQQSA